MSETKKVAIIGSGCAGTGAAWALKNTDYEVHIFEKEPRLGGHTNTQPWKTENGTVQVDTGFIVMNTATYPNFIKFLKEVDVDIAPTEMTFSVSRNQGEFEWSGETRGLFAQKKNLFSLRHWGMIFDIVRFNQYALDLLSEDNHDARNLTIGQYLDREGYSRGFRDDYLIPMTAAVWSTSPDKASLEFPAQTLIRFLWNHHLLSTIAARPAWLTIPGGSKKYIDAVVSGFPKDRLKVHYGAEVRSVRRPKEGKTGSVHLSWTTANSKDSSDFEHAIFACHGDQVLPILDSDSDTSATESSIFSAFQTTANKCYLHSDLTLMPRLRPVWTSWNYLVSTRHPSKSRHPAGVSLTYNMNILQHIPESQHGHVLVTMNPPHAPRPELTQGEFDYTHPLYTVEAVRAQERLSEIQGKRGVSFAGAWTKYGFHEDGFSSGLKVAMEHLGAELPFEFADSTYSRGQRPVLGWRDRAVRGVLQLVMFVMYVVAYVVLPPKSLRQMAA